ncbi:hypothetical protein FRX31_032017 [Thalictrum thalictroides]|uniref:Uncharacterized protein n=1 Tax=Thalictrum thalictroides TaxID=46969 RepID=A0A7J6V208_THATH|nr:hypothetical protein FRX31_032017 [Thalictrum thalictroides]
MQQHNTVQTNLDMEKGKSKELETNGYNNHMNNSEMEDNVRDLQNQRKQPQQPGFRRRRRRNNNRYNGQTSNAQNPGYLKLAETTLTNKFAILSDSDVVHTESMEEGEINNNENFQTPLIGPRLGDPIPPTLRRMTQLSDGEESSDEEPELEDGIAHDIQNSIETAKNAPMVQVAAKLIKDKKKEKGKE